MIVPPAKPSRHSLDTTPFPRLDRRWAHRGGKVGLLFDEFAEGGVAEALGGLRGLAVAHSHHAQVIGVPVHPQLELMDTGLCFGFGQRSCFHRHD